MNKSFKDSLCSVVSSDEIFAKYDSCTVEYGSRHLSAPETEQLAKKISLLPEHLQNIIYAKYCFGMSPAEAEAAYDTQHAKGKLFFAVKLLNRAAANGENLLDKSSFASASELALQKYVSAETFDNVSPYYSKEFRKKLKKIKTAQPKFNRKVLSALQRAAVVVLVLFIGFSTTMVANAELREAVSNWFITHFSDHSSFQSSDTSNNVADINFDDIVIGYVPDGFELERRDTSKEYFSCLYTNRELSRLFITISANTSVSLDTENTNIVETIYKNNTAFYWTKDNITTLVWTEFNLTYSISYNTNSIEEVFKIADEIKIK